ncbi:MAG TPA: penicillin acylase family protein [Chitinophagaceae bacterium]|nr:penicillin acylase family protein [Chitinophagaceae bacterium]
MKIVHFLVSAAICMLLIIVLGTRWLLPAPLAQLLSPQHGVWQNAEPADINYNAELSFPQLKGKAEVYFDERLVPHVFAENDQDAFFIQGYLHAKFRLWQMEFQTHAAAGRLSEIMGDKIGSLDVLNKVDRYFRRLGMGYAAEKSLAMMEADTATKMMCDAYTAGVNAYLQTLTKSQLPLEYKLLGYAPEAWTNLKTALFIKYMAFDLAGGESDFEFTAAKNALTKIEFEMLVPIRPDSLDPIIPVGTVYDPPAVTVKAPASVDSLYLNYQKDTSTLPVLPQKPDKDNGSNNWAVNGKKTRSGYPILCNDPHLGLNLPSLWYEMQIHTPHYNAYGATFPSAPGVIIGFNDSCAFGVTNAGRDVRDYYSISFKDGSRREYKYNGQWMPTNLRIEEIKIKGKPSFVDTVAYTIFGPVIFDDTYANRSNDGKSYAVRWKAHDASNEMKMFYLLDRAKNYNDYLEAIKNLHTPGQNCAFAAKNGDIAMWCQGEFPAKWTRQGDFVMPGTDSSYQWQGMIPQSENPHMVNPERNFVSSANQFPADSSYPYYLGGSFPNYRGLIINRKLQAMADITPQDMMELQTNNYNVFAEMARPVLLRNTNEGALNAEEKNYLNMFKDWNLRNDTNETGPVIFTVFWDALEKEVWADDLEKIKTTALPYQSSLLEGMLRDSAFRFADNINTPQKETLADAVTAAFKKAVPQLQAAKAAGKDSWAAFKDTHINHLTKLPALSRLHLPIGGGTHVINATKADHGPSWRMIVSLTPETEAYGIYPGGQNGNPGSVYYDNFIDTWANGKYYRLWVMKQQEMADNRVKFKMVFSN